MSALPPKADMDHHGRDVRFVPKADIPAPQPVVLFDHLVGGDEKAGRYWQAESFGGFPIKDGFVFCRSLHRKVSRFGTAKDAINVRGCLTILVCGHNPVGHETTGRDEEPVAVNRWHAMASSERDDEIAVDVRRTVRQDDYAAVWRGGDVSDGALDIRGIVLDSTGDCLNSQ